MLMFGIFGVLLLLSGAGNAIREHGRGRENHVTAYAVVALFGLGLAVAPAFMKGKPAEAATAGPAMVAQAQPPSAARTTPAKSRVVSMSFEQCLGAIAEAGGTLGIAPVNLVETNLVRMVRFPASDGSVLMTCSRPDQRLVITTSNSRCGSEVNC